MPAALSGQILNTITSFEKLESQAEGEKGASPFKAVIHFSALNRSDR